MGCMCEWGVGIKENGEVKMEGLAWHKTITFR